ncbi:MAG: amidohydrolase [Candidatus Eremiobacteraeota bacterium]|nr:amidohydrolase [Candidatus Eremiobacteraeota bacterium]MBV9646395.1 amidohydrolase [Candidatus Eremiobacteraeota bacterium]
MPILDLTDIVAHVTALRREIHRHPEPGFAEERTAAVVERELDALDIEHRRIARTGVVAIIRGRLPGHVVALRADMDALPIEERSGEPFSSEVKGMMHACGHDAHTAMLLGAARILQAEREALHGTVVLLFQPAEEGPGGALPMIEAGALADPHVESVAMLHVDSRLPTGTVGITPGLVNAAADEFYVRIEGRGGHGAAPHNAIDTIPCAAATVLALQNIAARETDPFKTIVVTIGTIEGGYRNNVIADVVKMSGTFRSQDPAVREGLEERARRIVNGIATAYGASATLEVVYGYPPVVNDGELVETFREYLGQTTELRIETSEPTMGGEDFAYFAQVVPGVMARLGIRNEATGAVHPAHSPLFRLDEAALKGGIETLVAFARGAGSGTVHPTRTR